MHKIEYILFDAANTLIHKPELWIRLQKIFAEQGFSIPIPFIREKHKLISEAIHFPDRTSKDFYSKFNSELLYALGVVPSPELLNSVFDACTYLPWEKFEDTDVLSKLPCPIGIVSNFRSDLKGIVEEKFGTIFSKMIISEDAGFGKPDVRFYEYALKQIDIVPERVLYIGDSIKLDIVPAQLLGIETLLIDRENVYPYYSKRIVSLKEVIKYLEHE